MEYGGLEKAEVYIMRQKNTVAQYIAMRTIIDLCMETGRRPGAWVFKMWLEKLDIKLVGEREVANESDGEEMGTEYGGEPYG